MRRVEVSFAATGVGVSGEIVGGGRLGGFDEGLWTEAGKDAPVY